MSTIASPFDPSPPIKSLAELEAAAKALEALASDDPDDWPEPEELGDELPPVPAFDLATLPASLRPLVQDTAERMGCAVDFPAAATVVALAAVTNRRAVIQPKAIDSGWTVVPNLWGMAIGEPATMKTPGTQTILAHVKVIETAWWKQHAIDLGQYETAEEEQELKHQVWRDEYKKAIKKGTTKMPEPPQSDLTEPESKRIFTNDPTVEKLHELLSLKANAWGLTLERDELAGFFANLSRPGQEGARAFYLECWGGDGSFTVDRIGRGSVHVEHLCLSVFGTTQPDRLRSLFRDEINHGASIDGLMQRFQITVYPDPPRNPPYVDRLPDAAAVELAEQVYRSLAASDAPQRRLQFSSDAQELFEEWYAKLTGHLASDELTPAMKGHLSKYRSLMPSLALLFSLADGEVETVGLTHTRQAVAWCEYLEKHAQRVYSPRINPAKAAAIRLGEKIRKGKLCKPVQGLFSVRDVYRPQWRDLQNPEQVRAALLILQGFGWVREVALDGSKAGRPSEHYTVNPKLWDRDAVGVLAGGLATAPPE